MQVLFCKDMWKFVIKGQRKEQIGDKWLECSIGVIV